MNEHEHDFVLLYKQPRLKDNILVLECDCGEMRRMEARPFLEKAAERNTIYVMDSAEVKLAELEPLPEEFNFEELQRWYMKGIALSRAIPEELLGKEKDDDQSL